MTDKSEIMTLADTIDYAIRTEGKVTFYKVDAEKLAAVLHTAAASAAPVADQIIGQIEERFPNWCSYRDLIDCIDCTLHHLRSTHPAPDAEIVAALDEAKTYFDDSEIESDYAKRVAAKIDAGLAKAKGGSQS